MRKSYSFGHKIVLLLFLLGFVLSGKANHIIGGDMYYECRGFKNNDPRTNIRLFRVYLELYRDCQARNAAYFDNPAHLTVFRGSGNNYTLISVERESFTGPINIAPPAYPCLSVPPNVCVHRASYVYDLELEISSETYAIVWQRCCRNQSINNIYSPGDVGASFMIEITPLAQQRCNNSPKFKSFPPTVICVDEPLIYDNGAVDAEGDNIVYEFCAPLLGGGRNFGGTGCNSPNPDPDCPPPYGTVSFRAPAYTSSFPLGGNPRVTIDPITGVITGKPTDIGQFVVGVCIKEYRNGNLLSTVRRDFQFNVSTCTPNFVAAVSSDDTGPNGELIVRSCGSKTVRLQNRSVGVIDSIKWEIDQGDSIYETKIWSPEVTFARGGEFRGRLIINPNTQCSDSAELLFYIVEEIKADFTATYDSCDAGPVQFTDMSYDIGSELIDWDWRLGARIRDSVLNPVVEYEDPGDYLVTLVVEDLIGCKDTLSQIISWQPAPDVIIVDPSVREGCFPLEVDFKNLSYPIDGSYDVKWLFSDGGSKEGLDVSYLFEDTGTYDLKLEVTSPIGCYSERSFKDVVTVAPRPIASFDVTKTLMDVFDPTTILTDNSENSIAREWLISNYGIYFEKELEYTFEDTGRHSIRLIAVDAYGCTDTIVKYVDVAPRNTLHFPTAFSPNGDGKNDIFQPVGLTEGITDFKAQVFDRWGRVVFESTDVNTGWDGTVNGNDTMTGVFILKYSYTKARGEVIEGSGFLTLIR